MNREIKFRAWEKEKQKMLFFDNPFHAMIISSAIRIIELKRKFHIPLM